MSEIKNGTEKRSPLTYRIIKRLLMLVYPRPEIIGLENLPAGECIVAGNHSQIHSPIISELYFPQPASIWCAGQMLHYNEVSEYAFTDFWSFKPAWCRWFYKILSYLIAPLCVLVFNNSHVIPVYRDARILSTFRETLNHLAKGERVIIFPEQNVLHNNIIYDFQDKFVDTARMYYSKTHKEIAFVPAYFAPKLRKVYLGPPTYFRAGAPIEEERRRICDCMMNEITRMAAEAPLHTVIPYRNIRKRDYPKNAPVREYK